jgi:hypothetical protein
LLVAGGAVAASLGWGCAADRLVAIPPDAVQLPTDAVEVVFMEYYTAHQNRERAVLYTQQEWADFWVRALANRSETPPPPPVDFGQRMVLVAAMGTKPTGGFHIQVDGVYRQGADLYVRVHEESPAFGCGATLALTAPAIAVSVPRVTGRVYFVESAGTRAC